MTTRVQTPRNHDFHIAEFEDCSGIEDGNHVVAELRDSSKSTVRMTLPLVLAERLGYSLLSFSAIARGRKRGEHFETAYPSDEARLVYDDVQGNARVDFRARGMRGVSILLSLSTLRELRAAIEKIDR